MALPLSYSIRSALARRTTTLLTVIGLALVVFVFAGSRMLTDGLAKTVVDTGSPVNAIAIRKGSQTEVQSVILRDSAAIITSQPEIATASDGQPLASGESVVLIVLKKRGAAPGGSADGVNVTIRGVSPKSMELRREQVKLVEGRMFQPGLDEVVAGKRISEKFQGASLGDTLRMGGREWKVVGLFDAGGSGFDSEVWGDSEQLLQAYRREAYSSMTLRLNRPEDIGPLKERLEADPRLTVEVFGEREYYAKQTQQTSVFLNALGGVISVIFSLGAVVGAMVTMYAAVANRTVEIGTMRAIGFRRRHVLLAFLLESVLLGLVGGVAGLSIASVLSVLTLSTTNFNTFSEVVFQFHLSPATIGTSLGFAVVMGIVGGFFPAVRASRLGIVDALRTA
ncbi:MAG: ABC transporter permease [Deltaproteobacteria bacterium]|nr:ABC transporter permease [Deltaproteobacteria bacterium]